MIICLASGDHNHPKMDKKTPQKQFVIVLSFLIVGCFSSCLAEENVLKCPEGKKALVVEEDDEGKESLLLL